MRSPGATIFGCKGLTLLPTERAFFAKVQPFGFILFGRNVQDPEQLSRLTSDLREAVGRDAPILIDQEGGRVQRMRPPHWRQWLAPLEQMRRASDLDAAARAMFLRYRLIGHELRAVGIDVNCAPMADVARADTHSFLMNRCFGEDTASVIAGARAAADGLLAAGVLPVLKHVPGHGLAHIDSHLDLPVIDARAEALRVTDFAPFRALSDLPMGMTAHIEYTAFDADNPATQSRIMIDLIRNEIGFDGLLMTDDISMQALQGTVGERSAASIAAGCDVVLHCNGDLSEMEEVAAASGPLEEPILSRANLALAQRRAPEPIDISAVEADLLALLDGKVYG